MHEQVLNEETNQKYLTLPWPFGGSAHELVLWLIESLQNVFMLEQWPGIHIYDNKISMTMMTKELFCPVSWF